MPRRRKDRIDSNQPEIVKALRDRGYSVEVGHDDLLVGANGKTYWYEVKTGPKAKIKDSQLDLMEKWKGHYKIVWNVEMILEDIEG